MAIKDKSEKEYEALIRKKKEEAKALRKMLKNLNAKNNNQNTK